MFARKKLGAVVLGVAVLSAATAAGATYGAIKTRGAGPGAAVLNCPGGMTRLGHDLNGEISVFPGDPAVRISEEYTVADNFFKVEDIELGAHVGTHLDAPGHFIEGGRNVDDLRADEFTWPVYKMDVRGMTFGDDNQIQVDDITAYEQEHGRIPRRGALFVIQTGAEAFFGAETVGTSAPSTPDDPDFPGDFGLDGTPIVDNVDDLFEFNNAGLSAEAVQWLFDRRKIDGVGTDAYGPDAPSDTDFLATYTTLANDGVALVAIANLDSVQTRGDIIVASTISLEDGSGFSTDPIACHGAPNSAAWDYDDDDEDDD